MNIVQITPGAGGMFCGGCLHDNALVTALRKLGHDAVMLPLYLPPTLDEPDQSAGNPIFFGGIGVYLEQKWSLFRRAPQWLRRSLASPALLRWAAGKAAKTRAEDVGDLTVSMLRGEDGHQARDLDDLVDWLKHQHRPQVVCLSNALLAGLARRLSQVLQVPVVGLLQGEDSFLDGLPAAHRDLAWRTLAQRAADVTCFVAPSRYYADLMAKRLNLPAGKVQVVPNGIALEGYAKDSAPLPPGQDAVLGTETDQPPVLGYFARLCPEKGLATLVDAYLLLKRKAGLEQTRLLIGGSCSPADESFVNQQRAKLRNAGFLDETQFFPNVDRAGKVRFFQSLSVFSAPALYGEAFGLYVIEALAAGVPVVQPRHAGFPEIIEATGGGLLCEPGNTSALAEGIASLLQNPTQAREMGARGQQAVREHFSADRMARNFAQVLSNVVRRGP